jgi:hypothetical protein
MRHREEIIAKRFLANATSKGESCYGYQCQTTL